MKLTSSAIALLESERLEQLVTPAPEQERDRYDTTHLLPGYVPVVTKVEDSYPKARVTKKHWYVVGDLDLFGWMSRYSKRGMMQDRFVGEPSRSIETHELFHASSERGGDEGYTRRMTGTEDPSMLFLHPALYCKN